MSASPAARLPIGADGETLRQWEPFSHCNPYPIVAGFDQWEAGTGSRGSCNIVSERECMILPAFECYFD